MRGPVDAARLVDPKQQALCDYCEHDGDQRARERSGQADGQPRCEQYPRYGADQKACEHAQIGVAEQCVARPSEGRDRQRMSDVGCHQPLRGEAQGIQGEQCDDAERAGADGRQSDTRAEEGAGGHGEGHLVPLRAVDPRCGE